MPSNNKGSQAQSGKSIEVERDVTENYPTKRVYGSTSPHYRPRHEPRPEQHRRRVTGD